MSTIESAFLKNEKDHDTEGKSAIKPRQSVKQERQHNSEHNTIRSMTQARVYSPEELRAVGLLSTSLYDRRLINEYRNLRTKLLSIGKQKNFVTLITSVKPCDSSRMIAANLASAFSLDTGKTSLLLNADSSSESHLRNIFLCDDKRGLVDFVQDEACDIQDIVLETPVPRLRFVSLGNLESGMEEHFTGKKMGTALQELFTRYADRYPIINAPSILTSADTRILVQLCDLVVLTVPYGECSEADLTQAISEVGRDKLGGIVLDEF